jgi:hypothetical protein
MFTKKEDQYSIEMLARDLEASLIRARKAQVNAHAIETALETMLRTQRAYIASMLRF